MQVYINPKFNNSENQYRYLLIDKNYYYLLRGQKNIYIDQYKKIFTKKDYDIFNKLVSLHYKQPNRERKQTLKKLVDNFINQFF